MPLSGFHGILAGFLVGIKQIIPDQELPVVKIKAKVWIFFKKMFKKYHFLRIIWHKFLIYLTSCLSHPLFGIDSNSMQWLPSLMLLLSIVVSFFTLESATYLPTLIFGTYVSWIYLRYWQRKPETKLKGDPSDDFAFSTFFPEFLR